MPAPVGQSCENCQYYFPRLPVPQAQQGTCQVIQPAQGPKFPNWATVNATDWCGFWAGSSGTAGLTGYEAVGALRGTDPIGDSLALSPTPILLAPSFATFNPASVNFELMSPGIVTMNYTTYTPSPTFEIFTNVSGVVVLRSSTNNQALAATIAQNGVPNTIFTVPTDIKTTGSAVPIPVMAGLAMKNGDTVSLWAEDNLTGNANLISYHLLIDARLVITF